MTFHLFEDPMNTLAVVPYSSPCCNFLFSAQNIDRIKMSGNGPSVAIVGGGVSGLVCANRLQQLGISNVTVFDTGKNSVGGRCSSRSVVIKDKTHIFDHSCQYFTVSDRRFANIVSFLESKKAVKIWNGRIGHLKRDGKFQPDSALTQAFIGTHGMGSVTKCLATTVNVQRPVWIAHVSWEHSSNKWKVDKYGFFDYLVIAHNGKCADKLMSTSRGAPEVHSLLRVRFNDTWNPRDARMHLCSLWILLVAFESKLYVNFDAAHVDNQDISWVSNNSSKYNHNSTGSDSSDQVECWTVISTKGFGKAHKVPQENIPPVKEKLVVEQLLAAFKSVVGVHELPTVCYTRVQLWGAALPINILDSTSECVFDNNYHIGVCGDWLVSPCIQGAAMSGLALAERICKHSQRQPSSQTSLQGQYKASTGSVIGCFPVDKSLLFKSQKQS